MSYDDDEVIDGGFKVNGDDDTDAELEIPEGMHEDFGLDEEDPDKDS